MGILNRTPDSFYDRGATWDFDAFLRRADELVADGADLLDVGGVKAGPGPEVGEAEELDRVVPAIAALRARFDVPLSVDTWRASVLDAACDAGAVVGNDISGFADPDYLARRGGARRDGRRDPHPPAPARRRPRSALRRSRRRRDRVPARSGAARRGRRARAGADRARRRPRPRQDARPERGAPPGVGRARRGSATRCCSPRRTSGSSASCSGARSTTGATSRWPRSRTASSTAAGSFASTTCAGARACAGPSRRCSTAEPDRGGAVVTTTLVQGADPSLRDREVQRVVDELLDGDRPVARARRPHDRVAPPRGRGADADAATTTTTTVDRRVARAADVRGGRERAAEPAVHDGVPRRRRARDRQPHRVSRASGSRRGWPIRSTACTSCSSPGADAYPAALDKALQGERERRRVRGRADRRGARDRGSRTRDLTPQLGRDDPHR